jgi:signal transduction histidine kinase
MVGSYKRVWPKGRAPLPGSRPHCLASHCAIAAEFHWTLRMLRMTSAFNRALVRLDDEQDLLESLCAVAVRLGGYRMAWVGYAQDDPGRSVRPVAECGFEVGYLASASISWADSPRGQGPTGRAIRTGQAITVRNVATDPHMGPWRENSIRQGYGSSIALPLRVRDRVIGALSIYASRPDAFSETESGLLEDLAGNLSYGITALRNREEQRKADEEKRLMEAQMLQNQKMEAIGRLAGGVAHDFNNLLQAILGTCELATGGLSQESPVWNHLRIIHDCGDRAAGLTRQLLAFSRKEPMAMAALDVNATVAGMERMIQRLIGEDIKVRTALAAGLPPILADGSQVQQVILNLVVNARDAMPWGGTLTLSTRLAVVDRAAVAAHPQAREGTFACLTVEDTGTGMAPEVVTRIFEPFFTTKERGKGTGLGLSSLYAIVERHGGWIQVQSSEGAGSGFSLHFPLAPEGSRQAADPGPRPPSAPARGQRILLIEDDEIIRGISAQVLREAGYQVQEAPTSAEGCARFAQAAGDFDLLFTDVVLPDLDGMATADCLRLLKPTLPVLLCSGYTADKVPWDHLEARGFKLLEKPFRGEALLEAVGALLGRVRNAGGPTTASYIPNTP